MGVEWLAIVMFAIFLVLLLVGYPVAFSFAGTAIVFGALGILSGQFDLNRLIILFSRWFKAVDNFTLPAIPFFVFMGAILEKSGLAERMLTTVGMALGRLKGGLVPSVDDKKPGQRAMVQLQPSSFSLLLVLCRRTL